MVLSNSEIEFYNDQGYLLVEDVISQKQLNEMLNIVDKFFEDSKRIDKNDNIYD